MVHGLGLVDDFRNIRAIYKLIGLIIAGALVAIGGALMDGIYLPLIGFVIPLGPLSGAITIFWLISISNAVNLIDGLDGLAGGTGLIAAFAIGVVHIILGNFPGALYSIILAGALLAFLVFNRPKAKIFMGDSGSLFLGFLLGALVFIGGSDTSSMQQELNQFVAGFVLTITVLIVPIVDMISAILRRLRERKPIHHPDKEHLHHKLLGMGFSTVNILFLVHGVNLLMGLAVVSWAINKRFGGSDLAGDAILVLAWILGASLFTWLHYAYRSKK
jgi:UDP-GlcNAc:undecaprenyl-phosphate GlcNAc-1-phosphate transferase